jgi:hypothetical protein
MIPRKILKPPWNPRQCWVSVETQKTRSLRSLSRLRPVARSTVDNAAARVRRGQRCALTPDRPPPAHALPTAPLHRGARPPEPPAVLRTAQFFKNSLEQPCAASPCPLHWLAGSRGPVRGSAPGGAAQGGRGGGTPRRARSALGAGRVGQQATRAAHRRMGGGGPVAPLRGAIYARRAERHCEAMCSEFHICQNVAAGGTLTP